ncbi:beta-galactosidase [Paenibacillus sp. CCS19]|uniref:glycoside hydrolase family 2 TIM barrel-domain containing protein n=1 Tax=Paenibacillus sp. CCS19 TaxID=3158387 RepID=UPI00256E5BF7|nr:glycoside hydrolase family 2 TIM barrel-domain containing protein [Paenibacillus cellulosilyticus]GMK41398.1 beta-galactosidase [Paenibacillus cellulosilyticus]
MTNVTKPSLHWLADPTVFAVNRLPAHSDHRYYGTMDEAKALAPMAMRHSLGGSWKFSYAVHPAARAQSFYQLDYDCGGWDIIEVPGHIQLQGYGKPQYVNTMYPWDGHHDLRPPAIPENDNPVGSYVKVFDLPQAMEGRPVFISFQGVESAFYVWLNGQFVGYAEDSFTPSEFDLTPYVQAGENKLAVEVYQRSTGGWLEDQDFWRFSGIFRDVYLYTIPDVHVRDLFVRTELDDSFSQGTLHVDAKLIGAAASKIVFELQDASGQQAAVGEVQSPGEQASVSVDAGAVQLWSAERPYLYTLYIQVFDASGALVAVVPQKVGFRRFAMVDGIMKINGERIVFKGVNRHEFNHRSGRVITEADMLWDIKTIKQNNMNAVRTSHYPNQTRWYELCDEYGIYLIDEMNLETHGSWQKMGAVEPSWNIPGNKPEWHDIVMDRAVSMVERDKNHPSILIWSCGNESYAGEVILSVSNYFRERDSSRLVHYEGVFHNRDYDATSDMESRMYARPATIEEYLNDNPQKPYISCEYMHAMGNSVGGMHKYTELENKYPKYQGGFIWDFIDQVLAKQNRYGETFLAYGGDFDDRATDYNFCTDGIVYADRRVSPKMQEVKYLYQNIKLRPDAQGVHVSNENLFIGTDGYALKYTLYLEGVQVFAGALDIQVAAQSEAYIPLQLPDTAQQAGEYALHVSLALKQAEVWADAGHEVAFGQYVFVVESKQQAALPAGPLRVANGDVNIGVHGRDFTVMFSKQAGSLTSLRYGAREMIAAPPAPLFWRATTDNDKGYAQGFEAAGWYAASLTRKCIAIDLDEQPGSVTVSYRYALSISKDIEVTVSYTVYADGSVNVQTRYDGTEGLPDLPIFALSFKVPADYSNLEYYALGPDENYIDRAFGARLGVFRNQASDNVAAYVVPQESGNRTGVRRVDIADEHHRGIRITAPAKQPVECNISPYTAFELENAAHHYELPKVHYTVVTVAGRQMGVGGDDSWGAPVHDEYLIKANQSLSFSFTIHPL